MTDSIFTIPSSTWASAVVPLLDGSDLLSLRAASSRARSLLHESDESEIMWGTLLDRDFGFRKDEAAGTAAAEAVVHHLKTIRVLPQPESRPREAVTIFGSTASESVFTASTCFDSWKHWKKATCRFYDGAPESSECTLHGPYFLRAASLWSKIEKWCDASGSFGLRVKSTFQSGITYRKWQSSNEIHQKGLMASQAIFSFYDGQEMPANHESLFAGLLGGYSRHDKCVCTRILGQSEGNLCPLQGYLTLALSFQRDKAFILHVHTGRVFFFSPMSRKKVPATTLGQGMNEQFDSALVWLEEYADRLLNMYTFGEMIPGEPTSKSILLYPTLRDQGEIRTAGEPDEAQIVSRAVTRGVEVVASSVFCPEFLHLGLAYIYSIRIRLLAPGDFGYASRAERGFETCQLRARHWHIHDSIKGETDHVNGLGVIGYYPLLKEGCYRADTEEHVGEEKSGVFTYQSCTGPGHGFFEGTLTFVPGSLQNPTGNDFEVEVAPFTLNSNPQFLY
eukprot:CAMPEP_0183304938 /NCGR_PEP_ID=MMETSP0160_2-20130417/9843_1 /TAXON_ID=2839 ORGANISM="Odontella Sinensis, Strain Grunow 1884" /NCGR_SAMPLE_ID=MMETSP0160_2 /ASSEMBLY_ACC=CAM_ASM_000250 /LENGTH=505 /DNA_ID=CAMNT_0025468059 /DNA_START=57 /DNA_END=1574 /DNA_ORIENTATION=+